MSDSKLVSHGEYETFLANCPDCQHKKLNAPSCDAFPAGIPAEILSGHNPHTAAYPGDHGIQFEPIKESS